MDHALPPPFSEALKAVIGKMSSGLNRVLSGVRIVNYIKAKVLKCILPFI